MTNYDEEPMQRNFNSTNNQFDDVTSNIKNAGENVKEGVKKNLDESRDKVIGGAEGVANAAYAAAEDLHNQHREGLSHYVTELADTVSSFADKLRHKNVDELMHEVTDMARRNPALFIGGTIALGLGIARFTKASAERSEHTDSDLNLQRNTQENSDFHDEEFKPRESLISGYTQPDGRGASIGDSSSVQGSNNGAGSLRGNRYE